MSYDEDNEDSDDREGETQVTGVVLDQASGDGWSVVLLRGVMPFGVLPEEMTGVVLDPGAPSVMVRDRAGVYSFFTNPAKGAAVNLARAAAVFAEIAGRPARVGPPRLVAVPSAPTPPPVATPRREVTKDRMLALAQTMLALLRLVDGPTDARVVAVAFAVAWGQWLGMHGEPPWPDDWRLAARCTKDLGMVAFEGGMVVPKDVQPPEPDEDPVFARWAKEGLAAARGPMRHDVEKLGPAPRVATTTPEG